MSRTYEELVYSNCRMILSADHTHNLHKVLCCVQEMLDKLGHHAPQSFDFRKMLDRLEAHRDFVVETLTQHRRAS